MKNKYRVVTIILVIISILSTLPISAYASTRYETLKFDKWYKLNDCFGDLIVYKFRISIDTVVTVSWKNYTVSDTINGYGYIYTDKNCNDTVPDTYFMGANDKSSGSVTAVLYKGTYYIMMYDNEKKAQVKVTQKTANEINKPNYCMANAILMKKGKKIEILQSKRSNYPRWYKINLAKKQKIIITGIFSEYSYIDLYDKNLNSIRCTIKDGYFSSIGTQTRGIYYLVLTDYLSDLFEYGKYYSICLK